MRKRTRVRRCQSGAALLMLVLVVLVSATAILVTKLNRGGVRPALVADTHAGLVNAKAALIEYAVTYQDFTPGASLLLPCPDIDAGGATIDGESHTANCGATGVSVLGRIPWRTLGVAAPMDSSGECLWYAVSGEHKNALGATSPMVNADTNGLLQVVSLEDGSIIAGATAHERPVAVVLAPMRPVGGQTRASITQPDQQCSDDFLAASFLETDGVSGISNASVSSSPDEISQFIVSAAMNESLNDRVLPIGNAELAAAFHDRHDFAARMSSLTQAIAQCVAAYGQSNPGGASDLRLPWPAPVSLGDYRDDTLYDDVDAAVLSGRLADFVDESNANTSNPTSRVLTDCNPLLAPNWNPSQLSLWQDWKDHFFYVVAEAYQPTAGVPSACGNCLTVNGSGQYAAIVFFAGPRLGAQTRTVPPIDADTKNQIANYLESVNASNHPYTGGAADFETQAATGSFNDSAFCIDSTMNVTVC